MKLDDPLFKFHDRFFITIREGLFSPELFSDFTQAIKSFYKYNKRSFLWRVAINPYFVVVSEIMLQQTQTLRVEEKFAAFVKKFPDFFALAQASQADVLAQWVGLGYNRRALALHGIARKVVYESNGTLSDDPQVLQTYKGLGPATASSIVTFAYNKPTVFIETNIRAVYLHTFFPEQESISDTLLLPLIEVTLDRDNPREWYYALMDYGVIIKKLYKNPSRKSKHYTKQSPFEGSDRQIRGTLIRLLSQQKKVFCQDIYALYKNEQERVKRIIDDLCQEQFIEFSDDFLRLKI